MHLLQLLALLLTSALGFPEFFLEIPNGASLPGAGHHAPAGGGSLNSFGEDFTEAGWTWSLAFCELDSDGDGLSNGQELGDPLCVWYRGSEEQPLPLKGHPGIHSSEDATGQPSPASKLAATKAQRTALLSGVKKARAEL